MTQDPQPSTRSSDPRQRPTPATVFLAAALVTLLAVVGMHLMRQSAGPLTEGPAPDFSLTLHDGTTFTLSDYRGRWVVVNFWGSWCQGCRDEAPELQNVWAKYRDHGVVVVGVGFRDVPDKAQAFIDEFDLTFPNGHDDALEVTSRFGITGAPETYIIDPEGNIVVFGIGQFQHGWLDRTMAGLLGVNESGGA